MPLFKGGSGENDQRSSIVNSAKTFLANIRFLSVDDPVQTIAITSAVPNEGKTFVTSNLASAIATSGKTVLLVECDMRRRSMASSLGVHAQNGIYAVLSGDISLTNAAVSTKVPNLYFLDAEPHIPNPSDIFSSERFGRLIDYATGIYDYVVFDTPPVGTFVDAAVLGTKVDAVFMVVREGFAKRNEVVAAAEQLRKSGCNLAGIVMNYCERSNSEYYYEYYYSSSGHNDENAPLLSKASRRSLRRNVDEGETLEFSREAVPTRQAVPQRPTRTSVRPVSEDPSLMDTDAFAALASLDSKSSARSSQASSIRQSITRGTTPIDEEY